MNYQCQLEINDTRDRVTYLYLNKEARFKWEAGLERIEMISGEFNQTGSRANLHFKFGHTEMVMAETIERNEMPHTLIAIYEVPGAWNRCVNHFIEQEEKVLWVMESEFKFDEEITIPLEAFISKTQQAMQVFKDFVENEKRYYQN